MKDSFVTDEGVTVPAVTAGQMREIYRIAMEDTDPNLFQMMENAGPKGVSVSVGAPV